MIRPSQRALLPAVGLLLAAATAVAASGDDGDAAMSAGRFMLLLALTVGAAKIGGILAERAGQPSVLGELAAGILVGPSVLGAFSTLHVDPGSHVFHLLAEVGVVLLLFEIGLETDLKEMLRAGLSATLVALIGVVVPFALGFLAVRLLAGAGLVEVHPDLLVLLGIFLGATLTATSIGITARVLKDIGRMGSPESRILIGAAVIDDILGLVILAVVTSIGVAASSGIPVSEAVGPGLVIGKLALSVGFLAVAIVAGRRLAPRAFDLIQELKVRGLLVTGALCFMLLLAFGATLAGTALIIGGFAAGLVLAETRQSAEIERAMAPVVDVFAPVFFVLVGAAVDVSYLNPLVAENRPTLLLTGVLLTAAVLGKLVAGLGVRHPGASRLVVGFGMVPRGEVGLIFAQAGNQIVVNVGGIPERLLSPGLYAAVTLTVMLTTLIAPPALRSAFARQVDHA